MDKHTKKILVADDDENIRSSLASILSIEGYNVITAENGEETMDKIKEESPDLLILDLMMPEMDGASVAFDLNSKTTGKKIPIIIVSGLILSDTETPIDMKNMNAMFLKKPFEIQELIDLVAKALKG
jgi:DNA-binding response OmpR family regulator